MIWVENLAAVPTLLRLNLTETRITDAGMVHLGKLKDLRSLTLNSRAVTGAGLAGLEGLSHLEELELFHMDLGRIGLSHLPYLPALRKLRLLGTK